MTSSTVILRKMIQQFNLCARMKYPANWQPEFSSCRYFTWDKMHFPTPIQMQERLDAHGRKLVTIIDPHIKKDDNYYVYKEAKDQGLFTKDKDGNDFDG